MRLSTIFLALLTFSLSSVPSLACNIPVFRYALENWNPDPYQVFVVHDGPLDETQKVLAETLVVAPGNHQPLPNMAVHTVELQQLQATDSDGDEKVLQNWSPVLTQFLISWFKEHPLERPMIVALYPRQPMHSFPAWHGELTDENVSGLIDSPSRQEIVRRVLDGETAVWVLVESGDQEKDDIAFRTLEEQLRDMPDRVSLPDQTLIETDEQFRPDTPIELKVEFSLIRLRRDDVREQPLVSMLLGSEDDLRSFNEPVAIPVYGRGRTYFALVGRGINSETIEENCQFLCGACSCQVKQENPGVDLLFAMNWQDLIQGSVMDDTPLPELTGIGAFEIETNVPAMHDEVVELAAADSISTEVQSHAMVETVETAGVDLANGGSAVFEVRLLFVVGVLVMAGVVIVAGVTLAMRRSADGR